MIQQIKNSINGANSYCLIHAHVPITLINSVSSTTVTREGLGLFDIEIAHGKIIQIVPSDSIKINCDNIIDLEKRIVLPCFVDLHTHLDKGHIWERSPNFEGTFEMALDKAIADSQKYWQPEDVLRRMEFSLKCAYAYGTKAIRTHLDCYGEQADISLKVFQGLQQQWQDKITLQVVSLVSADYYQTELGRNLADKIEKVGGILGAVVYLNPDLDSQLDNLFTIAKAKNLDLDLHTDENGDVESIGLQKIAEAAIRNNFTGNILCGHCCSLAVQSPEVVQKTPELVKQAGISIVSLPMCNLYLQDRRKENYLTPIWRGITRVHELKQEGIPVAFASDNTRDPFYGFGDLDMLEVLEQAVRIAHLDTPYGNWIDSFTKIPGEIMGLKDSGIIKQNISADLIVFQGRYFSELLSRSQHDRIVLRNGNPINRILPSYSELDDLTFNI